MRRVAIAAAFLMLASPLVIAKPTRAITADQKIVVLGGPNAVSPVVVDYLRECTTGTVLRQSGEDRYSTAAAVSAATYPAGSDSAFVATGDSFADAVSAGSPATLRSSPVLLVDRDSLPGPTSAELNRLGISEIFLLGGEAAVSNEVAAKLGAYGAVTRLGGLNRFDTAAITSRVLFPTGTDSVYIATGGDFPDALSGSVLAAADHAPILLTARDTLPEPTKRELARLDPASIVVLGGEAVVSNAVLDELLAFSSSVRRIAGSNRYATASAISKFAFPDGAQTITIATGDDYPDALVGGAAAGHLGGPVLLVSRFSLPRATASEISRLFGRSCKPFEWSSTPPEDWLGAFNWYRTASGLSPVVEERSWSAGIAAHLRYLSETPAEYMTGPYANLHVENPASPAYTPEGAAAGISSNLFPYWGPPAGRASIEAWLRLPLHAIGMLQPNLSRSAYAYDAGKSGLDVSRGLEGSSSIASPILFPGDGGTIGLISMGSELPDPLESCGASWVVPWGGVAVGLPLIALLPSPPSENVAATLQLPDGRVLMGPGQDLCVVTAATWYSSDPVYGAAGPATLAGSNAVVVIPRQSLDSGLHTVTLTGTGSGLVKWQFTVGWSG